MFERFGRDLARYFGLESRNGAPDLVEKLTIALRTPTLHAIAAHRLGFWIHQSNLPKPVSLPLRVVHRVASTALEIMWGIQISDAADIGPGFYIGHPGAVIIGPVKMGRDCSVSERVTIGRRTDGSGNEGLPEIGDRVWIGTGTVMFGRIHVGSGASIAPLTLVGRNVAPRSMVVGNPMQVMKRDHDNSHQTYGPHPPADPVVVPPAPGSSAIQSRPPAKQGTANSG
jgi:serine O-acetyltransferase